MKIFFERAKKILITGVNGLIGWNLFEGFKTHHEVFLGYGKKEKPFSARNCFSMNRLSIPAIQKIILSFEPDVILYAKGICDYDLCESEPELAYRINVSETKRWLSALKLIPEPPVFYYFSTEHVFSGMKGDYLESDLPDPLSVFGKTRLEAESLVSQSGLPYSIIRPGLLVASGVQGKKGPRDFLLSRLRAGKPMTLFHDEWRTPIGARHLLKGVREIIMRKPGEIFHIASSDVVSRYDLGQKIAEKELADSNYIQGKLREEDAWGHVRPERLTIRSEKLSMDPFFNDEGGLV